MSAQTAEPLHEPAAAQAQPRLDPRFAEYRKTGDRDLRNKLIEDHRWLAVHCARRFAHKGEPLDDLIQVAMLGVLKAIDRFEPGYGVMFTTFGVPTIVPSALLPLSPLM